MQSSKNIPFSRITTTIMLGCLLLSTAISSSSALRQDSSDGTRDVTKIDKQRRLQMVNSSKASKAQTKGPTKASSKASKAQTKGPTKAPTTTGATLVPTTVKGSQVNRRQRYFGPNSKYDFDDNFKIRQGR